MTFLFTFANFEKFRKTHLQTFIPKTFLTCVTTIRC